MKRKFQFLSVFCVCALLLCGCGFFDGGAGGASGETSRGDSSGDTDETNETEVRYSLEGNQLIVKCHFEKPEISGAGNGTVSVIIPGLGSTIETTSLPFYTAKLALPQNMTVGRVSVSQGELSSLEWITLKENEYAPAENPPSGNQDMKAGEGGFRAEASVQKFSGVGVAYVRVFPVCYQPGEKTLTYWQDITVTLALEEDPWDLSHLEEEDIEEIRSLVENPEQIDEYIIN